MRSLFATGCGALGLLLVTVSCGGSSYNSGGNPSGPSGPPAADVTTISIVGSDGSQAFNPNPATPSASRNIVWRNGDGLVHRIMANDGTFDTGNIAPGATSVSVPIPAAGVRYHCSLHPTMVGGINSSTTGTPPPCTGLYC